MKITFSPPFLLNSIDMRPSDIDWPHLYSIQSVNRKSDLKVSFSFEAISISYDWADCTTCLHDLITEFDLANSRKSHFVSLSGYSVMFALCRADFFEFYTREPLGDDDRNTLMIDKVKIDDFSQEVDKSADALWTYINSPPV